MLQQNWGHNFSEIQEKARIIDDLRAQEECFWHQRSRVIWLREGDANTKFFHQFTLQRRRRNKILKLKDKERHWVEHPSRVRELVENHFVSLFRSEGSRNWGTILDCVKLSITEEWNQQLCAPVSDTEIREAVMTMGKLKAPGPDGFQGIFYQSFWEHLNDVVNSLVTSLMQGITSPSNLNATHVVLIPKAPNPEMVS